MLRAIAISSCVLCAAPAAFAQVGPDGIDWVTIGAPGNRAYDREVQPGSLTGALHHVALRCTGYDEVKGRLDAMGAEYQENLVSAINLRQIFTPDPNNVLLELNFFAD